MAKPTKQSKSARTRHHNGLKKPRKSISHSDKKRTKDKVEKLNAKGLLPNELFQLNQGELNKKNGANSSFLAKSLEQDHKKDQETQERAKAKKQETNENLLQQIEMISGFSL